MSDNTVTKPFTCSPSRESDQRKMLYLEADFTGCTEEVLQAIALRDLVIKKQDVVRKHWGDFSEGDVIKVMVVDFAPRGTTIDPEALLEAYVKNMDPAARKAWIEKKLADLS